MHLSFSIPSLGESLRVSSATSTQYNKQMSLLKPYMFIITRGEKVKIYTVNVEIAMHKMRSYYR